MSLKILGKESLIYGFGHVVSRLITFLLLPIYTHTFSPGEYGTISLAYAFMGFALVIDGVDGTLARYVNVEEALPEVDGSTLDNVIDMFNYSILPVLMIYWFSMVPYNLVYLTCISILLASCYTFSDKNMKTTDYYFKGFSALWNLLVFFLFILDLGLWFNFGAICFCLILTFIPVKIIHPFLSLIHI